MFFLMRVQVPEAFGRCLLSRRLRLVPRGNSPLSILGRYNLNLPGRQAGSACLDNDPEPAVPEDLTPQASCTFEGFVFKVSAVHTKYRCWLRSSSNYEPSDPPIRLEFFMFLSKKCIEKQWVLASRFDGLIKS
jgi:hypothetical protein